ncbi:MAG: hypothetical protein AAGA30_02540 [Planctomycetota bacterium]
MAYRCEATSLKGFIQQIACAYLRHGYHWFVQGRIKPEKDPNKVDEKLINKYEIGISESTRWRRKKLGKANMQYIRYGTDFVLMATKGRHKFYDLERNSIRWAGNNSMKFHGYSVSYRRGGRTRSGEIDARSHAHVQIEREYYKALKAMFVGLACSRSDVQLARMFYELPFEPYAPVRRQISSIWREVNRVRKSKRLQSLPREVLKLNSRSVRVFEPMTVQRCWSRDGKWWYEALLKRTA